jgi:phospholipase C
MAADPIRHVIVLMFENHSFDQMLGCFKDVYAVLEGVDSANLRSNKDINGKEYSQRQSNDPVVDPDPKHELEHILNQLRDGNSGFVSEYQREYPSTTTEQRQRIMDYFGMGDLFALHELAKHFTICDHWHASVPGPTWTNRFFVHSGTSRGRVKMPGGWEQNPTLYLGYDQATIYDRLDEQGIKWLVYYGDVPQSLVLTHQHAFKNRQRYARLKCFFEDTKGVANDFPEFAFIEPRYFHIPCESPQNDDHPPHATVPAQELLADVYNALRANDNLWNSSLLVVVYDENGGFYDHVAPPAAVPPDDYQNEYTFDQLGVRVPAVLISPWVEKRVLSTVFDHTSILKYLTDKWSLAPLTNRVESLSSIGESLTVVGNARTDTPESVVKPKAVMTAIAPDEAQPEEELNDLQKSLVGLSQFLESQVPSEDRPVLMAAAKVPSEGQLARLRVDTFLRHK